MAGVSCCRTCHADDGKRCGVVMPNPKSLLPFRRAVYIIFLALISLTTSSCSTAVAQSTEIAALRDSLDAVQLPLPEEFQSFGFKSHVTGRWKVISICKQSRWDNLEMLLMEALNNGDRNIEIRITGKDIAFGEGKKVIQDWKYPDANIRIAMKGGNMIPYGEKINKSSRAEQVEGSGGSRFWVMPYDNFSLNDIYLDSNGDEVLIREDVRQVSGDIEKVNEYVWKFRIDLPKLTEAQCKDFYVLMTRDWTSARHKVVKVEDGWLYYQLDSDDIHSERDPNVDWKQYRVRPRYRLINNPVGVGMHIADGKIYIPWDNKSVRVCKGGTLITFAYCHFNYLEITGFSINGCGEGNVLGVYSSIFNLGAYIHHNTFTNISSTAISAAFNKNVVISDNTITNTQLQAISGGGINTTICRNRLKNIGWILNTRAITGGGENLHICDNVIEDFNYSAIACGSTTPNEKAEKLTYIIERNVVRLTKEFTNNYIQNSLADGGGIYIGPQCTWGIIRNNVVENIKGIHSNRGIFLDDGAKNLAIYGNYVINTANSYDIDLRYSTGYKLGIPDHNTNNIIIQNFITGYYRFEDGGRNSRCVGGENVVKNNKDEDIRVKTKVSIIGRRRDFDDFNSIPVDGFIKSYIEGNL